MRKINTGTSWEIQKRQPTFRAVVGIILNKGPNMECVIKNSDDKYIWIIRFVEMAIWHLRGRRIN